MTDDATCAACEADLVEETAAALKRRWTLNLLDLVATLDETFREVDE